MEVNFLADFEGWLIKVNGTIFPNHLIFYSTYKSTPNQITDLDSYTDEDGLLHRNPLPHTSSKIEFETKPMWLPQKKQIQRLLPTRILLNVDYWNDEENQYRSGEFYVPEITYPIMWLQYGSIFYDKTRIAFIEY